MKQQHIHQEVLVFTATSFSRKVLCETNDNDRNKSKSPVEKLEEAYWNGLLNEMLPEIISSGSTTSLQMFIWGIRAGKSYLLIDLADTPSITESVLSIDPHLFLPEVNLN
jgi:hypothetical protein